MKKSIPTFAETLHTSIENGAIFTIGAYCVCLRLSDKETYSNMKEFSDDGVLVSQYTDMLDKALGFAQTLVLEASKNPTLIAHAFITQLREDIGDEGFNEALRLTREKPRTDICYSHDYCDANMTMEAAMAGLGLPALSDPEDEGFDACVALWNASWSHAVKRMAAMHFI